MAAQPGVVMEDASGRRRSRATSEGDFEGGGGKRSQVGRRASRAMAMAMALALWLWCWWA